MAVVFSNSGKDIVSKALVDTAVSPSVNVGWGTGAGTALVGDTTLFTEDSGGSPAYARVAGARSQATTTLTNDTYQVVATLTANATKTLTNMGVFNAATGVALLMKADHGSLTIDLNDSITYTAKLKFTS